MMLFGIDQTQYCRDMVNAQAVGWLSVLPWENLEEWQVSWLLTVYGDHVRLGMAIPKPMRSYLVCECPLDYIEAVLRETTQLVSTLDATSIHDVDKFPYREFDIRLRDLAESNYLGACSVFLKRGLVPGDSDGFRALGEALMRFDSELTIDPQEWLGDRVGFWDENHWAWRLRMPRVH